MTTADTPAPKEAVTAALLVIGGKILSGRTKDQNIGYVAEYLTALGMHLAEVRVIGDEETAIVDAVNALRQRYRGRYVRAFRYANIFRSPGTDGQNNLRYRRQ